MKSFKEPDEDMLLMEMRIKEIVEEWAHDHEDEPMFYREENGEITFCNDDWYPEEEYEEKPWKQVEGKEDVKRLVRKGIEYMLSEFGWVYVYICKDNRIVAFEWPQERTKQELEDWKDHLKLVDEVIPGIYYEGWD